MADGDPHDERAASGLPRQVWGTPEDLAANRAGVLSPLQQARARRAAIGVPIVAVVFAAIMIGCIWLAFRNEPNANRIIVVMALLTLIPTLILVSVGVKSLRALRRNEVTRAIGRVTLAHGGSFSARKVDVRIGDLALPLLPTWAASFRNGSLYELYASRSDKNILSGRELAAPGDDPDAMTSLWLTFDDYRNARVADECSQCHPSGTATELRSTEPHEVTVAQLQPIATDIITHWGDADTLRRLLPRWAELLISQAASANPVEGESLSASQPTLDPLDLLRALDFGGWGYWSSPERVAVVGFVRELWHTHLALPPERSHTRLLLPAMLDLGVDIVAMLDSWAAALDVDRVTILAEWITNDLDFSTGGPLTGNWDDDEVALMRNWVNSESVGAALRHHADDPSSPAQRDAQAALDLLPVGPR